jgi:hypothetical protein
MKQTNGYEGFLNENGRLYGYNGQYRKSLLEL